MSGTPWTSAVEVYSGLTEADVHRHRNSRTLLELTDPRAAVLAHYGEACACCGSTEALAVSRITPRTGRRGAYFYLTLIRRMYPPGYQTLCRPCTISKARTPHCRLACGRAVALANQMPGLA